MKYVIFTSGIAILIFFLIFFFYCRRIEITFLKMIELKDIEVAHNYEAAIISDLEALESCMEIMPLKAYKGQGLLNINDFNFESSDYIISYGNELSGIKYNWYYALFC